MHDHVFLAAADEQAPLGIDLADVAGVQPAVDKLCFQGCGPRLLVIALRNVFAAYQHFAILGQANFGSADGRSDRAFPRVERMIQRHDGRGLGKSVALNDDEPEPVPEFFEHGIERRGTRDHRPEFPAEAAVHMAESPPTSPPTRAGARSERGFGMLAQDEIAQHLEDFRDGDQHRDSPRSDLADDLGGMVAALEHDGPRDHRRNEGRERLPEEVTERQEIQKANRGKRAAVAAILANLLLDRNDVREQVAMGNDDALRLGGRA